MIVVGAGIIGVEYATMRATLGRATAADGATNEATDSIIVTIADTSGPSLIVSSSKANRPVSGGDTLDVRVTANDSSGIVYTGYRLVRVRPTDSVLVRAVDMLPGSLYYHFATKEDLLAAVYAEGVRRGLA